MHCSVAIVFSMGWLIPLVLPVGVGQASPASPSADSEKKKGILSKLHLR